MVDYGKFLLMLLVDVIVLVNDVNDNLFLFVNLIYNCLVVENLVKKVVVCYVIVLDLDVGLNG